MLSSADNELITDTNPGTPMGDVFRRFWLPVALAEELPGRDCEPIRVKVLNEDLIAFRDSENRVGLVDAFCPHRGSPMFFGRNEDSGLRCIYHGWMFDVDGNCVDMPNAVEGDSYKLKTPIKAYPCIEAGDLIWAYMGPADKKPPFPEFEWTKLPKSHRYVTKFVEACNYLQAMEGDYDPSHARFLHSTMDGRGTLTPWAAQNPAQAQFFGNTDPNEPYPRGVGGRRVTADDNRLLGDGQPEDYGQALLTITTREQSDGTYMASVGPTWWMPIFCTAGISAPGHSSSNMRIPIDNESLMFYRLRWSWEPISEDDLNQYKHGGYTHPELVPGTWVPQANIGNDYQIDRVAQRNLSYSGIKTFPLQDIALIEAQWGPIADRTKEHLNTADHLIIHVRQRLLKAAKDMAGGVEPEGPNRPDVFRLHRETAVAATEDEAIELAREAAKRAQYAVRMQTQPTPQAAS